MDDSQEITSLELLPRDVSQASLTLPPNNSESSLAPSFGQQQPQADHSYSTPMGSARPQSPVENYSDTIRQRYQTRVKPREVKFNFHGMYLRFNPVVSIVSIILIWTFAVVAIFFPEDTKREMERMKGLIRQNFTWLYIGSFNCWLIFVLYIYFSKYSNIKLGKDDEEPEYSDPTYFAMLFSAGLGTTLFAFAVSEPIAHYTSENRYSIQDISDNVKAQRAMDLTFLHWGAHGWTVYLLVGMALGLMSHRYDINMTIRTCFFPLAGDRVMGSLGDIVDIFSVVCTMNGISASLAFGVMPLNRGLTNLIGISYGETTQLVLIWGITAVATTSVVTGMKFGIKYLSLVAFILGLILMFMVFFSDDTFYILNAMVQNVGSYAFNILHLGTATDALDQLNISKDGRDAPKFMNDWTISYYGWWVSWSPFVGMFIAKISRGRRIKDYILYTLTVPTIYIIIWFSVFGSVGIAMERRAYHEGLGEPLNVTVAPIDVGDVISAAGLDKTADTPESYNSEKFTAKPVSGGSNLTSPSTVKHAVEFLSEDPSSNQTNVTSLPPGIQLRPVKKGKLTRLSKRRVEEMIFDVVQAYDGLGEVLSIICVIALALYFITSSDSGSLVIDCLSANGIDEPPIPQRIFWALSEGACATALLMAGGENALSAIRAVVICSGFVYLVGLHLLCVALWRALQLEGGDVDPQAQGFVADLIQPFFVGLDKNNARRYLQAIFMPWVTLSKAAAVLWRGRTWQYSVPIAISFLATLIFMCLSPLNKGLMNAGLTAYVGFVVYSTGIRSNFRKECGVVGNTIEDFITMLFFYPLAVIQMGEQLQYRISQKLQSKNAQFQLQKLEKEEIRTPAFHGSDDRSIDRNQTQCGGKSHVIYWDGSACKIGDQAN